MISDSATKMSSTAVVILTFSLDETKAKIYKISLHKTSNEKFS